MFTRKLLRVLLIASVTLLTFNISPGAAEELKLAPLPESMAIDPDELGTAFSYQGRLMDGSNPATGTYDFAFQMFGSELGDDMVSSTIEAPGVIVSNGLFMIELDFGAPAYNGVNLWLQIDVKVPADTKYTVLLPRQKINPVPYAIYASHAGTIYTHTVVVKPVGTPADNGEALLDALASITGASGSNPYLLMLEPGYYDIGSNSLVMKNYVDMVGSGETNTIIQSTGFSTITEATVITAEITELRDLTIQSISDGDDAYVTAIYSDSVLPKLIHVALGAYEGTIATTGMRNVGACVELESVSIRAESGFIPAYGISSDASLVEIKDSYINTKGSGSSISILNYNGSTLKVYESIIYANRAGSVATYLVGIHSDNSSNISMQNSIVSAYGDQSNDVYGIYTNNAGYTQITDSTIDASYGNWSTAGIHVYDSDELFLTNTIVSSVGGLQSTYGILEYETPLIIHDSQINAMGNGSTDGVYILDIYTSPEHEITRTSIKANSPADPTHTLYHGMDIQSRGRLLLNHIVFEVEPFLENISGPAGGTGISNMGATINFENSIINSGGKEAFRGITHIYFPDSPPVGKLYVNNSEIYTCRDYFGCNTIYTYPYSGTTTETIVSVGSSLLWGQSVYANTPEIICMWVYDEDYSGFGWPDINGSGSDFGCP